MEIIILIGIIIGYFVLRKVVRIIWFPFDQNILNPIRQSIAENRDAREFNRKIKELNGKTSKINWQQINIDLDIIKSERKLLESVRNNYINHLRRDPLQTETQAKLNDYLTKPIEFRALIKDSANE